MNTINPAFRPARLRTLEITYKCDLSRTDGRVIPLGVLAELTVQGVYGLGLVARSKISAEEARLIGELMRSELKSPYAHLLSVFKSVFDDARSRDAFSRLPTEHSYSLCFKARPLVDVEVPRSVRGNDDARRLWMKDELSAQNNRAYWDLFAEHMPEQIEKNEKDDVREAAA
jgi:hypothetical protein